MFSRFLALLRNEIAKAARCKLPYFGLFAAALISVITFMVADELSGANTGNAWGYVTLSMQVVFTDIGLIFIAIFSAMLIAEEIGFGTARTVLSAPVSRWEFYLAKVLTGLLYVLIMSLISLGVSICLGLQHYKFGNISDSMGLIYSQKEVLGNFLIALLLSWLPLAAVVTYGLFISTIV